MRKSIYCFILCLLFAVSAFGQDGVIPNRVDVGVSNASSTGTTLYRLAKLTGAPAKAVVVGTSDTDGAIGVVVSHAGTSGVATVRSAGLVLCAFDGATTATHYVQISSSSAGKCHDTGASTYPTSGQIIGQVLETNGSGGTYTVLLTPGVKAGGGVLSSRAINTTSPITGGGDLSADRTIACPTCGVTGTGLNQFASTTSLQLLGVVSDETGTGALVFNSSPALIGTPTAPTAAVDTNTTQLATTAYVIGQSYLKSATAASTYAPLASPTFTGTVAGITKSMVGLGSADNTSDASKPVSTAQQTALDLKANLASPTFTGTPTLPTGTIATTQSAADSSTKVATTAFVTTADNLKADLISPSFTTPTLGVASATSINKVAITAPASSATLTIANGKTLTANNSVTLAAAADGVTGTLPATSASVSGVLFVAYSGANSGTAETDMATYTLPAGALNADGKVLRITAWGTTAVNANTKTVKIYFGATEVARPLAANPGSDFAWGTTGALYIVRSGATTQNAFVRTSAGASAIGTNENANDINAISPSETMSGTIVIRITGQSGTQSNDVLLKGFIIEILN